MVEPLEESRGLEDARAGGGQLEGERQAVEPAADLGDRRGVGLAEREAGLDLRGPLDEERHGRAAPERVERLGAGRGQLERRQAELGLGADLERRAAGGDDAAASGNARRARRRPPPRPAPARGCRARAARRGFRPPSRAHREPSGPCASGIARAVATVGSTSAGRGHRGERDEGRAARVAARVAVEQLDREARLAGAAVAGDREQTRPAAQALRGGFERLLPAEERCRGNGRRAEDPGDVRVSHRGRGAQLGGEIARGLESLSLVLLQAAPDGAGEVGRQIGPRGGDRRHRVAQDRREQVGRRPALERTPAGGHLVQDHPQREDVGPVVERPALHLLGRHVRHRPHHDALARPHLRGQLRAVARLVARRP